MYSPIDFIAFSPVPCAALTFCWMPFPSYLLVLSAEPFAFDPPLPHCGPRSPKHACVMGTLLTELLVRHPGSKANLGPFLNVVTWILLITSGLAVLTRLVTKRALRRRIDVDDGFVVAALVIYSSDYFGSHIDVTTHLFR
jgi:hypothetical protein